MRKRILQWYHDQIMELMYQYNFFFDKMLLAMNEKHGTEFYALKKQCQRLDTKINELLKFLPR